MRSSALFLLSSHRFERILWRRADGRDLGEGLGVSLGSSQRAHKSIICSPFTCETSRIQRPSQWGNIKSIWCTCADEPLKRPS
jgi:hypothetical protein